MPESYARLKISLCTHIANAKKLSIAFEHLHRSRHRNRSNRRRKIKINAALAENCSGAENRDLSISLCRHIANAKKLSIAFEHLDRSRHRNRLPGVDRVWIAENGAVDSSSGQLRRVPKGAGKSVRGPRDLKRDY